MTEYNRGSLCRLAKKIDDNPEYAVKIGISIEWKIKSEKEEKVLDKKKFSIT